MTTGVPHSDWQDMAFFCLFWLKMSPEQVAAMLDPGNASEQKIMTIYLRERFAYARRHAFITSLLEPPYGRDWKW